MNNMNDQSTKTQVELVSEFIAAESGQSGYDKSELTKSLYVIFDKIEIGYTKGKYISAKEYDKWFFLPLCKSFFSTKKCEFQNYSHALQRYDNFVLNDTDVGSRISDMLKALNEFQSDFSLCKMQTYVEKFYKLSHESIFNKKNIHLINNNLRKSRFLRDLICPQKSIDWEKSIHQSGNVVLYNEEDPFVCDSILHVFYNLKRFHEDLNTGVLSGIRKSLFCRLAERSFGRFINLDGMTYHIFLNRQTSKLLAMPYADASSIEDVKPLRLFEKIKNYIENNMHPRYKSFDLKIGIVSHLEISGQNYQRGHKELFDLALALNKWFSSHYNDSAFNLTIKYIVNKYDTIPKNEDINIDIQLGDIRCMVQRVDFDNTFSFSLKNIQELVEQNDLMFFIDCPWLYSENYDLKRKSSLLSYCENMEADDGTLLIESYNTYRLDSLLPDNHKTAPMRYLNAQYNRIMGSETNDAGAICRTFNDDIIKCIQKTVERKSREKQSVVYVFSSETDGLQYSYTATHPLMRFEWYEGKTFSIFQFCNYSVPRLSYTESQEVSFKIPIWSTFKYISIMYAYDELKHMLEKCFDVEQLKAHEYFPILRGISTRFDVIVEDDNLKLDVSLELDKDTFDIITEYANGEKGNAEKIILDLANIFYPIIQELYGTVLFDKNFSNKFGDEIIRKAFTMNLYSNVSNVSEMYFWFIYKRACDQKNMNKFDLNFKNTITVHLNHDKPKTNGSYFSDKRLYELLFEELEVQDDLGIVIKTMFYRLGINGYFGMPPSSHLLEEMLTNILKASEGLGDHKSILQTNAKSALEKIRS